VSILINVLQHWIYLTQLLQSEAMHYAYRSWRRQWQSPARRQCGGALVWQFNDTWPATSWGIVDYYLVKKPAFYAIKRDLAPLSVAVVRAHHDWTKLHAELFPDSIAYDVWVASSVTQAVTATVEVRFISIRTGRDCRPVQHKENVQIQPNGTTTICQDVKLDLPRARGQQDDPFVISVKLTVDDKVVSRDCDWPQPYKFLSFAQDRGLTVKLDQSQTKIDISASRPVKGLTFSERPGLSLGDNGFDIMPGEHYTVHVEGLQESGAPLEWTFLGQDESRGCKRVSSVSWSSQMNGAAH
jgi:beta-mannosidase